MLNKMKVQSIALGVISALFVSGCGEGTSAKAGKDFGGTTTPVEPTFNEQALLANIADNVIFPTFTAFNNQAKAQATAVDFYCQQEIQRANSSVEQLVVDNAKVQAKASWQSAMAQWQKAELMQVGPLLDNDGFLKKNIYSWPIVNSCAVDYDVVFFKSGTVNGQPYDITKRTSSRKGMAALEYLLFNEQLADSCKTGSPENWNNQTDSYRKVARCEFATEVAKDIVNNSEQLLTLWQGANGFGQKLKTAGTQGSGFNSQHEAVNRLSDAMFYIDSVTKDGKLAIPLGLFDNTCGAQPCPESVESSFAHQSIEHIVNNLLGFELMLTGGQGTGFIEYLIDAGDKETAEVLSADVKAAIENAQAYQQSLAETLSQQPDQVTATHASVKKVTDKLKVDFINSLALELPKTSAGDND